MAATTSTKSRKKTPMSDNHKAALAKGREEGRVVRQYLEALESTKPRRGRKRTPDSIRRRLATIESTLPGAEPLARSIWSKRSSDSRPNSPTAATPLTWPRSKRAFIKVARIYGERKGISYSAWRTVGVSASVLQQAKIPRTRS